MRAKLAFYLLGSSGAPGKGRPAASWRRKRRAAVLHRLEQVGEGAADDKLLRARLEDDDRLVAVVAVDARDGAQVDDGAAMDLPEELRVEFVEELLDRFADQRLALGGDDFGVLVLGVKVEDLVDRNESHRGAERGLDPFQRAARIARLELRQDGGEVRRRPVKALLETGHDFGDALGRGRLEDIVDCALL